MAKITIGRNENKPPIEQEVFGLKIILSRTKALNIAIHKPITVKEAFRDYKTE